MKDKEALKLALEALEFVHCTGDTQVFDMCYADKIITAIKEALAQPEQCKYGQEPKSCTSSPMDCQCALDATFAQPEQEPVAWAQFSEAGNLIDLLEEPCGGYVPLYTTPPQRTWVGLTEEDKQKAFDDTQEGGGFWEFADAIEAKLKEKNT